MYITRPPLQLSYYSKVSTTYYYIITGTTEEEPGSSGLGPYNLRGSVPFEEQATPAGFKSLHAGMTFCQCM